MTGVGMGLVGALLGGCATPIGTERVSPRQAYSQVDANALRSSAPSWTTVTTLHRYSLDRLAARQPDEAVRQLHQRALATGERDLLFALAELSYVAGEHLRRSVKPWDPRDARDYYLGSAVYAWLFLFGEGKEPPPSAFDRRFRDACDFYNYSLGLALTERKSTNGVVQLQSGRRRLPTGEIELQLSGSNALSRLQEFEQILLADQFRVRGMSVRNRQPGVGAPVICVRSEGWEFGIRPCVAATVLLRGPSSLEALSAGNATFSLELYTGFGQATVTIAGAQVPLELDLTTFRSYALSDSRVWRLGKLGFIAPTEHLRNQLIINQPYEPGRIPVVFVHGTFSSPVTWAEMANSLTADPVLYRRYQMWSFVYGSGNPMMQSVADFREALTAKVKELDPEGTNAALRQMVVIGHSQGGLLTKGTAIHAGDRIWRVYSTNRLEELDISETQRAELRNYLFLEPLPFVKRIVFIATPHRGSYLASGLTRRLARRVVSTPGALVARGTDLLEMATGDEAARFFRGRMPTSLDGMSPRNPGLLAMAEIPVAPEIKAHSIIAVRGEGDCREGRDGVVSYESAHVDYVQSEFIVRSKHSCLKQPATIEEVRRILHEHLQDM